MWPDGVALALFTSPGCALCKRVAPAADALAGVAVRRFDEAGDPEAWAAANVPGAPFAVALGPGGVVLAKGTVNDPRQLESVVAAARARADEGSSRRVFLGRAGGAVAGAAGAGMVGAVDPPRRRRGVPLLRPHLHDRRLPAPDRPAADRPARLPAAGA